MGKLTAGDRAPRFTLEDQDGRKVSSADFKGRKVINYRYGDVVFATQGGARFGMGPAGKDEFECGGFLEFPGAPYCISAANVN